MPDSSLTEALERFYHQWRDKLGLGLHQFVRDGEEDVIRMRRRFHIHICLLTVQGTLTYFSIVGIVSITLVTGTTTAILAFQEAIDRAGKF